MSQSYSSAKSGASDMMDRATDAANTIADQGRHVASRVREGTEDAYYATERTIREYPFMTVVMGVAVGFALGALWKSNTPSNASYLGRMWNQYEPQVRNWRHSSWF